MNESNDQPDRDQVAASIELAAGAITVPDAAELRRNVQSTFERRRRRRRISLTAIVGATALVSGVALVAVVGDDGSGDRLMSGPAVSTPASEPEPVDTTSAPSDAGAGDDAPAATSPPATSPAATAPSASSGPIRVTGSFSQSVFDDAGSSIDAGGAELFAWNDGFLAVRRSPAPQTLPDELPEELAAAFPQEVLDLFPDGLPATIEEATVVLQEAGLFDVVSDIVLSNDEVRDAIYSEVPELITSVRFSVDGVDWNDVDADLPSGDFGYPVRQLVVGDRFVVVTEPAPDFGESVAYYDIHVSTDLVQWDVQRVVLPERAQQRGVQHFVQLDGFAGNESGWIGSVSTYVDIDVAALLPEDVAPGSDVTAIEAGGWVDTGYDDDGVYIERFDDDGVSAERRTFSWAELGFDGPPVIDVDGDRVGFVSEWNGVAQQVDVGDESLQGVERFSDGFVQFGDRIRVSSDGVDWTDLALPVDGWASWVLDTPDGLLVSTEGPNGSAFHLLDPDTMTWTPVELPSIPSGAQIASPPGAEVILLADYGEAGYVQPATIRLTAEAEGYALTVVVDPSPEGTSAASYELLDVASGQVVVTESVDESAGPEDFTSLRDPGNGGFAIDDPDTGEVLVEFDPSTIEYQSLDENGDLIPEPDGGAFESVPTFWVVASLADQLLVEQVEADTGWLSGAAVQGNIVLVTLDDGSFVRLTSQ